MFARAKLLLPLCSRVMVHPGCAVRAMATGESTLFEKIANKSIPSKLLFEDDVVYVLSVDSH